MTRSMSINGSVFALHFEESIDAFGVGEDHLEAGFSSSRWVIDRRWSSWIAVDYEKEEFVVRYGTVCRFLG